MSHEDDRLAAIQDALSDAQERALPPVQDWHPARTDDVAIRIDRDGQWFHEGRPIRRERMVRLFSTVLRVDDDDETYLVTPEVRLRITVDDAPFTAVGLDRHGAPDADAWVFTTNVGERVVADADHPIVVEYATPVANPRPYVVVRHRLRALMSRAVFMQLAEHAIEHKGSLGVFSRGVFMPLAPAEDMRPEPESG